ncbi:hypothetical protein XH99_30640 [Bradyrhizobium nanningense]|uniref:Uncharacterized protein n=1 Tax=Bradyrhizobium nanningense TaxID=1325118 RepID=A0A4Q0RYW6_9BRAD|nr:hypothetical protein XH99_30640 [Bradyrhizobium nanningense]RXH31300.1 hypothetical protein XH84_16330 [Bradyrhizobium nanningense]
MDRDLQYHAQMISREKQAKAVKRMISVQRGREIGARPGARLGRAAHFGTHLSRFDVPSRDA